MGEDLEKEGNLQAALQSYRVASQAEGQSGFGNHRDFARVLLKMGKEREAFQEYKTFFTGKEGYWSSSHSDPILLISYGDLCLKFASKDDAFNAFKAAAGQKQRDEELEPIQAPRNLGFNTIQSSAYTSAALRHMGHGDNDKAISLLERAIASEKGDWVPRFYLARHYAGRVKDMPKATDQASIAETLAPGKYKAMILEMRRTYSIPDKNGVILPSIDRKTGKPLKDQVWKPINK